MSDYSDDNGETEDVEASQEILSGQTRQTQDEYGYYRTSPNIFGDTDHSCVFRSLCVCVTNLRTTKVLFEQLCVTEFCVMLCVKRGG